jgi:uncharacterized tellurite resistance protein B-like protein
MIKGLKALFGASAPSAVRAEATAREAAAALLVETALADHHFSDAERARIALALGSAFGVSGEEAESLVVKGEELAHRAVDHYRFTKVVKEQMSVEEREALVEQLWRVAMADGANTADEDAFIRRICPLLAIDDRARVLARKRAEAHAAIATGQD